MRQETIFNIVRGVQFFFALSRLSVLVLQLTTVIILSALATHFGGWVTLHTWHNLPEIHFLLFDGIFMIFSIFFILVAKRIKIIETEMRLTIFALEFLNQALIFSGFILLSVSFGGWTLGSQICTPYLPPYDSPYFRKSLVTCHLIQTATAVSATCWICWVATSVFTFREVYRAHKSALEGKAIGLDEQPAEVQGYTDAE